MTEKSAHGAALSAFAYELLRRTQETLVGDMGVPGRGAFGRVTQHLVVAALKRLDPSLHENPGAGTPDCWCRLGDRRSACEIKYTDDGVVGLGQRDVDGMRLGGEAEGARLIVLDIELPARLWVLEASTIQPGECRPAGLASLHQRDEGARLLAEVEQLLRVVDVDLIGDEAGAKREIDTATARLAAAPQTG